MPICTICHSDRTETYKTKNIFVCKDCGNEWSVLGKDRRTNLEFSDHGQTKLACVTDKAVQNKDKEYRRIFKRIRAQPRFYKCCDTLGTCRCIFEVLLATHRPVPVAILATVTNHGVASVMEHIKTFKGILKLVRVGGTDAVAFRDNVFRAWITRKDRISGEALAGGDSCNGEFAVCGPPHKSWLKERQAEIHKAIGAFELELGNTRKAKLHFQESLRIYKDVVEVWPNTYHSAYLGLGKLHELMNSPDEAVRTYKTGLKIADKQDEIFQDYHERPSAAMIFRNALGITLQNMGRHVLATRLFKMNITPPKGIMPDPGKVNRHNNREEYDSYINRGNSLASMKDYAGINSNYRNCRAFCKRLPGYTDEKHYYELADSHYEHAVIMESFEKYGAAVRNLRTAISIIEVSTDNKPSEYADLELLRAGNYELAEAYYGLAVQQWSKHRSIDRFIKSKEIALAIGAVNQSESIIRLISKLPHGSHASGQHMVECKLLSSRIYRDTYKVHDAFTACRDALVICRTNKQLTQRWKDLDLRSNEWCNTLKEYAYSSVGLDERDVRDMLC